MSKIRTKSQKRAVFNYMHKDYRMKMSDGSLQVMWYEDGTKLGPIEQMPEDIFQDYLKKAIKKAK